MKNKFFSLLYVCLLFTVVACSTSEDVAAEGSTSNDAERLNRIDTLSAVRADSVVIQKSFSQPAQPVTKRKKEM